MKTCIALLLLLASLQQLAFAQNGAQTAAQKAGQNAASLTLQFDNRRSTVLDGPKRNAILKALADYVFLVPVNQVSIIGGINQSGLLNAQSVVTYRAVGPTTNGKSVLANCQENARGRWLGLRSSVAESQIKKATDTWWPGDSVDVQKAQCAAA